MINQPDDENISPKYALQPSEVWNDYEQTVPDHQVKGICSTYWSSVDTLSMPPSRFAAEFIRYHIEYDAAYATCDNPPPSYSEESLGTEDV
jgi:hypothetical protein